MIANLVAVLLAIALLLLAARGRAGVSWPFTAYLATCLAVNRLVTWWPATFQNYEFWCAKESLYVAFKFVVLAELTRVGLRAFPRARRMALLIMLAITIGAGVGAARADGPWSYQALSVAQAGTVWGFAALLAVALWFRLPLHPLHRAIMTGFALYLGAYSAALGLVRYLSLGALPYLSALDAAAYAATLGLWALAAVRPYEGEPAWPPPPRFLWRREA